MYKISNCGMGLMILSRMVYLMDSAGYDFVMPAKAGMTPLLPSLGINVTHY